ncbi:protein of unknown function [Roseateles sp. YR242]|uniref:DUF4350 domain-containing protein n=1 Tax=Roseateles sp. YR242 TaxID=1855305 RepID=UPI0008BDB8AB|nr:DUF4350 domain-containing protein [Roseateles sp. YR242]SEK62321.1 protein of unknown function [Roseateles sp. YR242]
MTRDRLWWGLALLALAASGWWLSANTEWAERKVPRGATGEARENPVYAFEQLMRKLGLQAVHHDTLDPMPPPHARLVLLTDDWSLVPTRAERLHQWVLQGGHLVLLQGTDWDATDLGDWVPVDAINVKERLFPMPASAASAAQPKPAASAAEKDDEVGDEDEDEDVLPTAVPDHGKATARPAQPMLSDGFGQYRACGMFHWGVRLKLQPGTATPTWQLNQGPGAQGLRLAVGEGSVTVLNSSGFAFQNRQALECDHALLLSAALQAEPGATVWLYLNEKRESLVPWLWHSGWIAVVFGALALLAALWRGAVRFGPQLAPAPRLRRSISEQVRGLGSYLHRHGSEALLAAQQRALDDTATRRLAGYSRLPVHERAQRIAEATGTSQPELFAALSARFCTRAELPQRLQLLESARRRLQRTHDERHPR